MYTTSEIVAEIDLELKRRSHDFPKVVEAGRATQEQCDRRVALLVAARERLVKFDPDSFVVREMLDKERAEIEQDPAVLAVMEAFPGAVVDEIRSLGLPGSVTGGHFKAGRGKTAKIVNDAVATSLSLPAVDPMKPLKQARFELRQVLASGEDTDCPVCGQGCKVYSRALNRVLVHSLMLMAKSAVGLTSKEIVQGTGQSGGGDHHKLVHFGLVEQSRDGKRWLATDLGRRFLRGAQEVPHRVLIFAGSVLGLDRSKHVKVGDIDSGFSIAELRSAAGVADATMEPAE